jgi:hypothetical protein
VQSLAVLDLDSDGDPEILAGQLNEDDELGSAMPGQVAIYRSSNGYSAPAAIIPGVSSGDSFGYTLSR